MKYFKKIASVFAEAQLIFAWSAIQAGEKREISEYIGSQACLSCHSEKFSQWKPSNHAEMLVPIINSSDLPLDISKAPANLQPELRKASYWESVHSHRRQIPRCAQFRLCDEGHGSGRKRHQFSKSSNSITKSKTPRITQIKSV